MSAVRRDDTSSVTVNVGDKVEVEEGGAFWSFPC